MDDNKMYRSDLTFFFKEEKFLKKYLHFWAYVSKLKGVIDNVYNKGVLDIDGI